MKGRCGAGRRGMRFIRRLPNLAGNFTTMNMTTPPLTGSLYDRAKQLLDAHPDMGKGRLANLLGVKTPTSRLLRERWRGETQGHSQHPDYLRVRQLKEANLEWGPHKISQQTGLTVDIAKVHLSRWQGATAQTKPSLPVSASAQEPMPGGAEIQISGDDINQSTTSRSSRITSIEQLVAATKTDLKEWEIERHIINKWEVGTKDPVNGGILTAPLFQVKLWLRRRVVEQRFETMVSQFIDRVRSTAPVRPPVSYPAGARGMLELSLMDIHLGKYCWSPETGGRNYDPAIAVKMFWEALEDLLQRASGCRPEKLLFVVGNDFFNVDTMQKTTANGTPQDEAGRWQESWLCGRKLLVDAIERLRQVAPVKVVVVQGNHDYTKIYYLGSLLEAHFRNTPGVEIDNDCRPRKYVHYGQNLIGFIHGDRISHEKLPMIMAQECRELWAKTQFREWHLGHFHSKKTKVFVAHQDLQAVQVRLLPSLCPADAWHASMGYFSKPAAEAYFWDADKGCVAKFTHSPN